jgi:beta-ureidopropionase / N-carbamoyl-L-amino-acid hydrolase
VATNVLEINAERLWESLERSAEIGRFRDVGLRRLALSAEDKEMRDLFVDWAKKAGCTIEIDRLGNIFARRAGSDPSLPPVAIGSHLDTQICGGRYDGILGVLCGLEVVRTLNDRGLSTKRGIEVICWTNEEGARFTPPMVASGAFAGVFDVEWVLGLRDDDGLVFGRELARIGYDGKTAVGGRAIDAYFELHIEQGPILDHETVPVGIVTGGYAVRGMHVDVHGETAHSGPTPMDRRRNALVGAAMLAVSVNEIGWTYHPTEGKATVARLVAWPNKAGILAEYAQLTCDVRHADRAVADRMWAEVKAAMDGCAHRANVQMRVAGEWQFGSERFDPGCIRLIREAAQRLGVAHRDILSQAGHDAYYISRIAPTAMIFTPCRDGISHNEAEHADRDTTVPGVNVLLHAVLDRANR